MSKSNKYVFVLWGKQFKENMAAVFVTELRQAKLQVKLVGLTGRQSNGSRGLALIPDITVEGALPLADKAICVVVPCGTQGYERVKNDPRLDEFFYQAHLNKAKFVLGTPSNGDTATFPLDIDKLIIQPDSEDLIEVAREVAVSLRVVKRGEPM